QSRGPNINKNNVAFNESANVNQQKPFNNKGKDTIRNSTPSSSTGPSTNSSSVNSLDIGFKITTNFRLDKIEAMMLQFQQHITNFSNVVTQMQTQLAAQQQIADKKMDAILEKLTRDPSPRRHDSSSSRPYPRTRSSSKSNIPRSKSGPDLHSGYIAKDHSSQVPPTHQDLLIPLTNSPPAATQSEQ